MRIKPTAESFIDSVFETAPVAGVQAQIAPLQHAGAELQRLHEALSPLADGKLEFASGESFRRFSQCFAEYLLQPEPGKEPLKQFLVRTLLEETATPEARRQFAEDMAQIAAGARQAANVQSAPDAPEAWVQRTARAATSAAEPARD